MVSMHLQLAPLQNPERYQSLARALTELAVQCLGAARESCSVLIDDLPAARWHVGGQPVEQAVAQLRLSLPAGLARPSGQAEFAALALQELQRQLGHGEPLALASGVLIDELPAGAWRRWGVPQPVPA